jgi:hypothetical protein
MKIPFNLPKYAPFSAIALALLWLTAVPMDLNGHEADKDLRHWETASADPDRIFLSFHGDPATRRAVNWRTDTSVSTAVAQIAEATGNPKFDMEARSITAVTETLDLSQHDRNLQENVNYHAVVFDALEPDTLYAYRVGSRGHWSEWIQFRTAKQEPAPFSFVYFGDAQNEILSKWSRVIRMSYEKAPDASFAIHAGDIVDNGHHDILWAEWFKAGGWIHSQRTGIPVVGNHEIRPLPNVTKGKTLSIIWRPQFNLPEEPSLPEPLQETVYTVDYQGVRIIVLNSLQEVEAQADYIRKQMERPGANWTILTSHYSIFSPRPKRDYLSSRLWLPIIEELGIDLVLQGHDHVYVRGHQPVRLASGSTSEAFQTMFVTSVSGAKQYKIDEGIMAAHAEKDYRQDASGVQQQFFQVIAIDGNTLSYKAYSADGELFDEAMIVKDGETGAKTTIPSSIP